MIVLVDCTLVWFQESKNPTSSLQYMAGGRGVIYRDTV